MQLHIKEILLSMHLFYPLILKLRCALSPKRNNSLFDLYLIRLVSYNTVHLTVFGTIYVAAYSNEAPIFLFCVKKGNETQIQCL